MHAQQFTERLLLALENPWLPDKPSAVQFEQGMKTLVAVADNHRLCVQQGRKRISKQGQASFFKARQLRKAEADGAYLFDDQMIVLQDQSTELLVPVLAHELGHFFLSHHGQDIQQEIQAEATAFLMLDALGLANPMFSANYICQEMNHTAEQAFAVWQSVAATSLQAVEQVRRQHLLIVPQPEHSLSTIQ